MRTAATIENESDSGRSSPTVSYGVRRCAGGTVATIVQPANRILVGALRDMPFVAMSVMMAFLRGLSDQLSDDGSIAGLPPDLAWLGRYDWGLPPQSVGIALIVPLSAVFGRHRHRHQHQNKRYRYQKTTLPPQTGSWLQLSSLCN
jgi:hypothetical protein